MPKPLDRAGACQSWGPYVRCIADLMWLRDWTVTIANTPPGDGAYAAVECLEGRKQLIVEFSDAFLDELAPSEQRQIVVHELTHAHLDHAAVLAHKAMGDHYPDFLLALEYGVDGIADAWAGRLPLPSHVRPARVRRAATQPGGQAPMAKPKKGKSVDPPKGDKKAVKPGMGGKRKSGKKGSRGDCY
jgi:glyoxylase-like metal-dependent hydrolase (beta-lactamase superfamily II)